jgi:signal transduction histidine kinase
MRRSFRSAHDVNMRFLAVGFVATLVLAVVTVGLAISELNRIERAALELADESSQSTYYIADVSEKLARYRAHVTLGLRDSPAQFEHRMPILRDLDRMLTDDLTILPGTLEHPANLYRWQELAPQVDHVRAVYQAAADDIRTGQSLHAVVLLDQNNPTVTRVHDALDELSQRHRSSVVEQLQRAHDEGGRILILQVVLITLFAAGLTGIFALMTRVLRRQRRQITEYTSRLETVNTDLDAFAGRVAHDLRNALGPVMMTPALLRDAPSDPAVIAVVADRTERAARRAVGIVDALLAFSRAAEVEFGERAELRRAVDDVLEELAPLVARRDATVEVDPLPDAVLRCSPSLLHVLLANLCGNAIKYLEGQPVRRVHISATLADARCQIDVEDTGPGIPASSLGRIFDPFYRVPETKAVGTGIGLATVRRIVGARGGSVTVQSREGHGSCFRVTLPTVPSEIPAQG